MRVAIDFRMHRHTGIGTYLRSLLPELAPRMPDDELVLMLDPADALPGGLPSNVRAHVLPFRAPIYSIREQLAIPIALASLRPDIYHAPHFNVALAQPFRTVVTIHDLIYLLFAESCPSAIARLYAKLMYPASCHRARFVLAVSEHTGKDVERHLGVSPAKIVVTPEGLPALSVGEVRPDDEAALASIGIEGPFFLYVGLQSPHKNVTRLIEAYAGAPDLQASHQLVLAGKIDPRRAAVTEAIAKAGLADRIIRTGFVSDEMLDRLYRHAAAFVFPSLYEGFGLPPLEAMARRVPVACSNAASLPESAGDAAVYFDPLSTESIAGAMRRLVTEPGLAETLREKGWARSARMSWSRCAELTVEAYRRAAVP